MGWTEGMIAGEQKSARLPNMPCTGGRELKQMLANAVSELAEAKEALADETTALEQRERRVQNAEKNHAWTSKMLLEHLQTCAACRTRESALRPAVK